MSQGYGSMNLKVSMPEHAPSHNMLTVSIEFYICDSEPDSRWGLQNLDFLPMPQKRAEMFEPNGNKTGAKALEGVQET